MLNDVPCRGLTRANKTLGDPKFLSWTGIVLGNARLLALAAAVMMLLSAVAAADDKKDCFSRDLDTEVNIKACSRVIDGGLLGELELAEVYNRRAFMRCLVGDFDGAADDTIEVLTLAPEGSFEREEAVDMLYLLVVDKCV